MPHTDVQTLVKDFHEKYEMPIGHLLHAWSSPANEMLQSAAEVLMTKALLIRKHGDLLHDVRLQRATLMIEELAEILEALHDCDKVALSDGLGDLAYVVYGTGVAYGLPVTACVQEIHASNMTKNVGKFKPTKGKNYCKPDIKSVLRKAGVTK